MIRKALALALALAVVQAMLLNAAAFDSSDGSVNRATEMGASVREPVTVEERQDGPPSSTLYSQLRAITLSGESASVENLTLKRDAATITFKDGQLFFLSPVEGRVTGAVFVGNGEFSLTPLLGMEKRHLSILSGGPSITEQFSKMVLRFTDSTYEKLKKEVDIKPGQVSSAAQDALNKNRNELRKGRGWRYNLDARILVDLTWPGQGGLFQAFFDGKKYGDMLYGIDPLGAPFVTPEEIVLVAFSESNRGIWVASHLAEHYRSPDVFNENHQLIDLLHHKIEATVKSKSIEARVQTRFKSMKDGPRVIPFDLYPTLRVKKVVDGQGRELAFIQEKKDEDADFYVALAEALKKGQEYTLTFEYGGDDAVSDSGGGNYTLNPGARTTWYPNSTFGDRATYEMTFKTPKDLIMVATGQPVGERKEDDYNVTEWKSDVPLAVAGFNYGRFKRTAIKDEKIKYEFESFANRNIPDSLREIQQAIEAAEAAGARTATTLGALNTVSMMDKARSEAQIAVGLYSELFGPLPYGRIAMTQQPFFGFGQAWPMLVYMPLIAYLDNTFKHQLGIDVSDSFFKIVGPHEVAHQWWGHIIGWKSYRDQWMSEGFSHFSASMFAQMIYKNDLFIKFWKEQRDLMLQKNQWGRRPVDVGGVYMGYRLDTAKTGAITQRMIYPKGGFILHMLRMLMWDTNTGDERFKAMMRDFVKTHYNQNVSTFDFKAAVERHITPEMNLDGNGKMDWFFNQWVFNNSIPDYKLDYRLDPAEDGKVMLTGRITQSNVDDNFKMRVPIYLDFDGRIVRLGTVVAVGNSSTEEFKVPLPRKPKRILLCYYEDVLCTTENR